MGVKITGLNKLKKLQNGAKELSETKSIPITELLTDTFLIKNTDFNGFVEFENSEIFSKYKNIEDIPDDEMDEFIRNKSNFDSWEDLLSNATEEYVVKKLGF
ncbi:hypothetical protein MTP04_16210 [Lysinibacillus sp. PLM2]|nr:hypothetical protein MTP04_16210 [Lysinibacillus sp. PLM2]